MKRSIGLVTTFCLLVGAVPWSVQARMPVAKEVRQSKVRRMRQALVRRFGSMSRARKLAMIAATVGGMTAAGYMGKIGLDQWARKKEPTEKERERDRTKQLEDARMAEYERWVQAQKDYERKRAAYLSRSPIRARRIKRRHSLAELPARRDIKAGYESAGDYAVEREVEAVSDSDDPDEGFFSAEESDEAFSPDEPEEEQTWGEYFNSWNPWR